MPQKTYTFDKQLQLKDAGLVAASAAAQVGGADKVVDLGAGRVDATVVIDISAIEVATGDESYHVELQLSTSPTFASGNFVASVMKFGDATVNFGSADTVPGRYELPFSNEQGGTIYRYARLFTRVAGTIATGINYSAFLAKVEG